MKEFALGEQVEFVRKYLSQGLKTKEIVSKAASLGYSVAPGYVYSIKFNDSKKKSADKRSEAARKAHITRRANVSVEPNTEELKANNRRGPRPLFFICISGKNICYESVQASTAEEAAGIFATKHGKEPDRVDSGRPGGGYYESQKTGYQYDNRLTVTAELSSILPSGVNFKGQFTQSGVTWDVIASGVLALTTKGGRKFADNELFIIQPISAVKGRPTCKPKIKRTELVFKDNLTNLKKI